MMNYPGFGLILESLWGAVEHEDFFGQCAKTHSFSAKNAPLFCLLRFCRFPHACYGFVQKVRCSSSEKLLHVLLILRSCMQNVACEWDCIKHTMVAV